MLTSHNIQFIYHVYVYLLLIRFARMEISFATVNNNHNVSCWTKYVLVRAHSLNSQLQAHHTCDIERRVLTPKELTKQSKQRKSPTCGNKTYTCACVCVYWMDIVCAYSRIQALAFVHTCTALFIWLNFSFDRTHLEPTQHVLIATEMVTVHAHTHQSRPPNAKCVYDTIDVVIDADRHSQSRHLNAQNILIKMRNSREKNKKSSHVIENALNKSYI